MTIKSGTYTWKLNMRADAQKVGEELEALHEQHNGLITPQNVVDAAKSEQSEMHPLFTWDDSEAAKLQRQSEARYVMRNIMVVVHSTGDKSTKEPAQIINIRHLVNATTDQGRGYIPITTGMADSEIREQILETAIRELAAWQRKYQTLEELAKVFDAIDMVAQGLKQKLAA